MAALSDLHNAARDIFNSALHAVDARTAIRRELKLHGAQLTIRETKVDLTSRRVFVVALGKAASAMATGLSENLGDRVTSGIVAGPTLLPGQSFDPDRWKVFAAGHPLPNQQSFDAAAAAFALLRRADEASGLVIFLISGGGSAMMEWPVERSNGVSITLEDIRAANRRLISCGASIAEVNAVRRSFSAVKGGKLASLAPRAKQITLIVSDTNRGDEASVASGPSLAPQITGPDADEVIRRYDLETNLPESILATIEHAESVATASTPRASGDHYVLLDNQTAIDAAAERAIQLGFTVEIAGDISEQPIDEGSRLLVSKLRALRKGDEGNAVCLISGGEFSCPVHGKGIGGRNLETALRCAMEFDRVSKGGEDTGHMIALSAGTDGIDGNSPAAGAIADETSIRRGRILNLDAESFLSRSDSFGFFNSLGDAIVTGTTETNVRDLRILLASK